MKSRATVLHVLDAHAAPWACLHALSVLAKADNHRVLLIGNTADSRRATGAGLVRFKRFQARGNDPRNATRTLSAAISQLGPFDRIVAWDERSAAAASKISTGARIESPPEEALGAFPALTLDRHEVRAQWDIDASAFVVGSAHDHPREVNAMRLVYHAAILSVAERPTVVVVPSGADQLERAARFAWRHNRSKWFVIDDRSPLLLRDAIDASCWQVRSPQAGTRTLAMLAHSGQPVIAERCAASESIKAENVSITTPQSELAATKALFGELVRVDAQPDPDALIRAFEGSLAGV